jgi:hypothetical protein
MKSNTLTKQMEITSFFGKIDFDPGYNYKKARKKRKAPRMTKKQLSILFILMLSIATAAPAQTGTDALTRLKITPADAGESVLDMLRIGRAYHREVYRTFKALVAGDRAGVVKSGLAWIRSYTASSEFSAKYASFRNENKPEPPEAVQTVEAYFTKQKKDLEAQFADSRKAMASMDAETKKTLEAGFKQMIDQITAMEKDPAQREMIGQMLENQRSEGKSEYEESLAAWNRDFPENPKTLIAVRIRAFLEISEDVDFNAKLVKRNALWIFANEEYEAKSQDWKLCYRAGREATTAARAFLQKWLADLEG